MSPTAPLLFIDLDNTAVDRTGAVTRWAHAFAAQRTGRPDPALAQAIIAADGNGTRPKPEVAEDLQALLGLDSEATAGIIKVLRAGVLEHMRPDPEVDAALRRARSAGFRPFVVTNGNVAQQNSKLDLTGLRGLVDGMVISEGVGVAKPDPRIFTIAAEQAGGSLTGAWMVGDTPGADIAGAQAAGIASAWIAHGRTWRETSDLPEPTVIAETFPAAIDAIIAGGEN